MSSYCFATLALGKPFRDRAKLLAADLEKFAPGHQLVVSTDSPDDFKECGNVAAYPHQWTGLFNCWNDKRFAVAHALENHAEQVVFIDADTRMTRPLPDRIASAAFVVSSYTPSLQFQVSHYLLPKYSPVVFGVMRSFGLDPENTKFVMDSMFAIRRDNGREKVFLQAWDRVTRLFDYHGVLIGDGTCVAIAAGVTGWIPSDTGLEPFSAAQDHEEVSGRAARPGLPGRIVRRISNWVRWKAYRRRYVQSMGLPTLE